MRINNKVEMEIDNLLIINYDAKHSKYPPVALGNASFCSSQASTDDLADPELDRIGSDIEDGGLDLSLPFKPIGAYVENKREMLDQCFHVLGEKKLRKMLPDELKVTETHHSYKDGESESAPTLTSARYSHQRQI